MKWPVSTEGWLVIWTPIILGLKRWLVPDLDVPDESLVTVVVAVAIWIVARISKKQTVKRNGNVLP